MRRRGSASVAVILLALGVLGVAVVALAWLPLPDVLGRSGQAELRPATATVIESAPCGSSTAGDLVEVRVDGTAKQARFDGCGHTKGQELQVQVPVQRGAELTVRPADSESSGSGDADALQDRMSWVLLTLAAVAGGGYMLMMRSRPA